MGARHLPSPLAIAVFTLLALLWLPAFVPVGGAAPTPPTCQVTMNDAQVTAKPSSSVSDRLVLQGTIDVDLGSLSGSRPVSIMALVNIGEWSASVDPANEDVTGVETIPVNATLVVPAMTPSSTTGTLTVTASFLAAPGFPGTEVSCDGPVTVFVQQYYGLTADTSRDRITVKTGSEGVIASVILHNLGNGVDTFTLDLEDRLGFEGMGIHARLPVSVRLEPNAETNATFPINASSEAKEDAYPLLINVRSEGKPTTVFTTVSITLIVDNIELLSSLPDPTTLAVIGAVAAAGVGTLLAGRRIKRRRAARDAEARLKRIVRQRREAEGAAAEPSPFEGPAPEPEMAPAPQPSAERVRVRVKAPPKT